MLKILQTTFHEICFYSSTANVSKFINLFLLNNGWYVLHVCISRFVSENTAKSNTRCEIEIKRLLVNTIASITRHWTPTIARADQSVFVLSTQLSPIYTQAVYVIIKSIGIEFHVLRANNCINVTVEEQIYT